MNILNKKLTYFVLDVFTNERYKGNPLAVVCIDYDMELNQYQNIAREFGYSETSFIYYSAGEAALKVRSFTATGVEVNGAGHNLLGAIYLAVIKGWDIFGNQKSHYVVMQDDAIPVAITRGADGLLLIGMLQQSASILKIVPADDVASALSLQTNDLALSNWGPTVVKTEVAHLMVPVKNTGSLTRAVPNIIPLKALALAYGFEGCYCFAVTGDGPYIAQSRFFNPGIGINEDAATGSAAGPLAGFLLNKGLVHPNIDYTILQGVEMGQPSTIKFRIADEGIWINGTATIVMEGLLYL